MGVTRQQQFPQTPNVRKSQRSKMGLAKSLAIPLTILWVGEAGTAKAQHNRHEQACIAAFPSCENCLRAPTLAEIEQYYGGQNQLTQVAGWMHSEMTLKDIRDAG